MVFVYFDRCQRRGIQQTSNWTIEIVVGPMVMEACSTSINKLNWLNFQCVNLLLEDIYFQMNPRYVNSNISIGEKTIWIEHKVWIDAMVSTFANKDAFIVV